jgi:GNAT superfamily N-acetyltransferase
MLMVDGLVVRHVERADFEHWLKLWAGYNAFYERKGPTAVSRAVTEMTWGRFFDAYEPMHALVADQGGHLLGMTHYIFHRNTTMTGPVCYLQDLFTNAEARGKGIGRALIEGVSERAREAGSTRVYWNTHETNTPARLLYDKVASNDGFIVYRKPI